MYIADHLSRAYLASQGEEDKEIQVFALEVETLNRLDSLTVSSEKLPRLQNETEQDTVFQTLKTTVLVGWPEQKSQIPIPLRDFWNYRDEISLHTPNANMVDHSVGARDKSNGSEASEALMFCFDNAFPERSCFVVDLVLLFRPPYAFLCS